jgi:hypothetical protein
MRSGLVLLICLGVALPAAHAGPAIVIEQKELTSAFRSLAERLEEPTGMVASADVPKLGLRKGDLVRTINGLPASSHTMMWEMIGTTTLYLDVLRDKKPTVVVVTLKVGPQEITFERDKLKELIARLRDGSSVVRQLTKKGAASGVLVTTEVFGYLPFMQDTIIRTVNGKPTATVADVIASLEAAVDQPTIRLGLERNDQTFTFTMVLEEAPPATPSIDFAKQIKKLNDTTYEVAADLRDTVLANPMAITKGARVVPAMQDGKPIGFKLYAIRPSSIYAALGIANGDTLVSANGSALDSTDKALEVYTQLRKAKQIKLELIRRGKPITITYTFK